MMVKIKKSLSERFEMKDLGMLHQFLGVKVVSNTTTGAIWIGQPLYIDRLLLRFGMDNCSTPASSDSKLMKKNEGSTMADQKAYQAAVGSLLYL